METTTTADDAPDADDRPEITTPDADERPEPTTPDDAPDADDRPGPTTSTGVAVVPLTRRSPESCDVPVAPPAETELSAPEPPQPPSTPVARSWWPRRWWTRTLAVLLAVVVLLAVIAAPSLLHALTRPGTDSVAARVAEWGRDHGLGPMVTWLEARQYDLHQPPTGGLPAGGIPRAAGVEADRPGGQPAPPPLPPPAGLAPLPGEGQWQTVVSTPRGDAARVASVRPDAQHTSFVVGVLWMDPTLVRGTLHPGTEDPGGPPGGGRWATPPSVTPDQQRTLITAFSGGFRLQGDSHGGWYADGREARPLVPGAASLVLRRDGTADVGTWGDEVRMGPDVAAVRQNLIPLVDHGVVNPTCATGGTKEWGSTVGQAAYIHRSAFGVTPTGAMVYVAGPALSVCTLGELMRSAGVVRGMELDINPAWTSGYYFQPNGAPRPDAFKLFADEQVGSQHYLQTSGRDFFSFGLRDVADTAGAPPATQHRGASARRHGPGHHG